MKKYRPHRTPCRRVDGEKNRILPICTSVRPQRRKERMNEMEEGVATRISPARVKSCWRERWKSKGRDESKKTLVYREERKGDGGSGNRMSPMWYHVVEIRLKCVYWISRKCDFGFKMAEVKWVKWGEICKSNFHLSPYFNPTLATSVPT